MTKTVLIIASGETERIALPHLVSHLRGDYIEVDVRIPPRNRQLTVPMAEKIIKANCYLTPSPDKFVVLVDLDGRSPESILGPMETSLEGRLPSHVAGNVLYAYAQWHLEAWYFADVSTLRDYLGGSLGHVDTSQPDRMQNPKLHLKHLLGARPYTSRVSQEIASKLNPQTISQHSPSFRGFLAAVRNGPYPSSTT